MGGRRGGVNDSSDFFQLMKFLAISKPARSASARTTRRMNRTPESAMRELGP